MSKFPLLILGVVVGLWVDAGRAQEQPAQSERGRSNPHVIMYATKTCGYCAQARAYFKSHGVRWDERDIEASAQARAEWKALGGFATPLIVIDQERLVGFSQSDLDAELAKYGR